MTELKISSSKIIDKLPVVSPALIYTSEGGNVEKVITDVYEIMVELLKACAFDKDQAKVLVGSKEIEHEIQIAFSMEPLELM